MSKSRHINKKYLHIAEEILGRPLGSLSTDDRGRVYVYMSDENFSLFQRKRDGECCEVNNSDSSTHKTSEEKLAEKILSRYSAEELKMLASGKGICQDFEFKEFELKGEHHKFGVLSDTHIGSRYVNEDGIVDLMREMELEGCEFIVHLGDITEGLKKTHGGWEYSQKWIGFDAQKDRCVDIFSQTVLPIYAINGNHDLFYVESNGANIGKQIGLECKNFIFLGNQKAVINVGGCRVMLFHGNDGSPKTKSYRQQDIANNLLATEERPPQVLLLGHVHKYCVTPQSGIMTISAPSCECLTDWMAGKRLVADCGGLILDMETKDGELVNFSQKYIKMPALVKQTDIVEVLNVD